jgi:hypothetical protein
MEGFNFSPVPWFVPVVAGVVGLSTLLILRGWGKNRWTAIPVIANVVLIFVAVNQFTLAQDAHIALFAQRGLWPPPVARFYLYVGALAFLPLLISVIRAALFVRDQRAA